tara:strand:- start:160 stop:414 length:255 start_codon:yes stop_codon:yes gene_type:complete
MQPQGKSFQVFGDGIPSSSIAIADSNWGSSSNDTKENKVMSMEWAQATIFFLAPLFFMLLIIETNEDDDGPPDGGLMTPVFERG